MHWVFIFKGGKINTTYLGYWIVMTAIIAFIAVIFGFDLGLKDKILMVAGFSIFIGSLLIGLYLMGIR